MNYDAFVNKWNGKQVTAYSGECVALVAQYCVENGKPIAYANAKDWWGHPALTGAFDFITNNPNDLKQIPPRGAIMIWNGGLAGSGGYGHIAIFDGVVSPGVFRSFDQNWGGRQAHFVTHNWNNIIGWMIPKTSAPAQSSGGDEMIANADQASKIYKMLRPNGGASQAEIDGTVGRRSFASFLNDAQAEIAARDANIAAQARQVGEQQNIINQLNQTVTNITSQSNATKADKDAALVKIAELTAQLTTETDKLKDAQKALEEAKGKVVLVHDQETKNMITSIYNYFVGQFKTFAKYVKKG